MEHQEHMKNRVVVLADVPIWVIPGLEKFYKSGAYATWFDGLIPEFENATEVEMHWVCLSKQVTEDLTHNAWNQKFHVLKRGKKSISILTGYWAERRKIRRRIEQLKPDIVHAWGTEDVYGLAGASWMETPKLFSIQGCLSACIKNKDKPPWLMRLQALYEKHTVKAFQIATGESPLAVEHLKKMNSALTTHVIDYGVPKDFFDADRQPAEEPNIMFIGSVNEAKGIRELYEAMISADTSHIKLKVAGDGDLLETLREKGGDNIEWLGRLDRQDLIKHMESAWALVLPTYADTGPSVVKEARVVGLPVITTTAAGASCYIKDGRSGFVIEPGDVEGLIKGIQKVTKSKEVNNKMGAYGWDECRAELRPEKTAERFLELYSQMFKASVL